MVVNSPRRPIFFLTCTILLLGGCGRSEDKARIDQLTARNKALEQRLSAVPAAAAPPTATAHASSSVPVIASAPSPAVNYVPGAVAIIHAAPTDTRLLTEVPADSVGGFVFTGAPITLHDLSAQGVRYTGLTGVELQGWFKATQAGRYQFGEDLQGWVGIIVGAPCVLQLWLEDRVVDTRQSVLAAGAKPGEQRTSLVVGSDLQPGLYKLRLWTTCIPNQRDARITADLLVKAPSDMNLRGFKPDELLHQGGAT